LSIIDRVPKALSTLGGKRVLLVTAAAATALLTLVGAALAENYQYRFTKADQALAAQVVQRGAIKGWTGGAVKPDLSPDPFRCPGYAPRESDLVVTGDKETDYTYKKTAQELDTYAVVLQSAAMVESDWQRSNSDEAALFRCLRAKLPSLLAPGSKIVSLVQLKLPRFGTHSFAYRLVFRNKGSQTAIDSVNIARGRIEAEVDQVAGAPTAKALTDMQAGDRLFASDLDAKLRTLG
jgi:hypothetical protein